MIILKGLMVVALLGIRSDCSIIRRTQEERTKEKELSDADHGFNGHNTVYDHEAFLGKESAREFDKLTPEESRQRLGVIVDKIDTDNDKKVTEPEMVAWIKYIQRRYVIEDSKMQWKNYDKKETDTMSWEEYRNKTYGTEEHEEHLSAEELKNYKEMKDGDFRRFKLADVDFDGKLTFSEYANFLHPEDAPHMRDVVVKETLDDLDANKDGTISEEEYLQDMWPDMGKENEPDWVKAEREHFNKWRDLNKDGKLDYSEVQKWIVPDDYDHAVAESKHLIYTADSDKDGTLSKEEILEHYDTFVGSQATDFGNALTQSHDEF